MTASAGQLDVAELYRRHIVMVRGRALRILGSPAMAEDVAQEVFIKYLKRRSSGAAEENPGGFLYRMTTNLALNQLRNAKRRRELLEQAGQEAPDGLALSAEDKLAVRKVLAVAPDEEALIASYYYLDEMEQEEIAEVLNLNRRTVGRRLERFRERASRLLKRPD